MHSSRKVTELRPAPRRPMGKVASHTNGILVNLNLDPTIQNQEPPDRSGILRPHGFYKDKRRLPWAFRQELFCRIKRHYYYVAQLQHPWLYMSSTEVIDGNDSRLGSWETDYKSRI